jgi:diamine N-acetyltransferase
MTQADAGAEREEGRLTFTIRAAVADDAPAIAALINGLADYERLRHESNPDIAKLRRHLDPTVDGPHLDTLLAEDAAGAPLGFALCFPIYSTFLTNWSLFLEDLFVIPSARGHGVGGALLRRVAQLAVSRGCARLEWRVLDWNTPAIEFYRHIGAVPLSDWETMRLDGSALIHYGT